MLVVATVSLPAHRSPDELPPDALTPDPLTPDELEHSFTIQCKALRILVREGRSLAKIRRTACWLQLETLHDLNPRRYPLPERLHDQLHNQLHNQFREPRPSLDR
jgi:hypothetical protein